MSGRGVVGGGVKGVGVGGRGPPKVRCGPATKPQPRLPSHGLHCHLNSTCVRYVLDCAILLARIREARQQHLGGRGCEATDT